jgi:hypothetical protein
VVLDVTSHLLLAARTQRGPTQDSPAFPALLRQARRLLAPQPLDTVLADGAYDAERHHVLAHERLGVAEVIIPINPRNTGRRWPLTPYRRAVKRRWVRELKARYGARWHVECGFSRHKRRLGSALRARRLPAQRREMILRVLTHNLMILARRRRRISTEHVSLCDHAPPPGRAPAPRAPRPPRAARRATISRQQQGA